MNSTGGRTVSWTLAALIAIPAMVSASTFYDWTFSDTTGATGYLEFNTTGFDPANFLGLPVIAGRFDFDGPGNLYSEFDIFDLDATGAPSTIDAPATFEATSAKLVSGLFVNSQATTRLEVSPSSVICFPDGFPPGSCGRDIVDNLSFPTAEGEWTLRTTAVPEPATVLLLGVGVVATLGVKRRRRNCP